MIFDLTDGKINGKSKQIWEAFMDQENQTPHKRRVRYKGKYPKKFEEKYKELQPEKYQDTIQHVIQKGNTCLLYTSGGVGGGAECRYFAGTADEWAGKRRSGGTGTSG